MSSISGSREPNIHIVEIATIRTKNIASIRRVYEPYPPPTLHYARSDHTDEMTINPTPPKIQDSTKTIMS
jgi:hypothetical protein